MLCLKAYLDVVDNIRGGSRVSVLGVQTNALLIKVPFLKEHIFNLHVLAEQGASLFVKTKQDLNHRFPIYAF